MPCRVNTVVDYSLSISDTSINLRKRSKQASVYYCALYWSGLGYCRIRLSWWWQAAETICTLLNGITGGECRRDIPATEATQSGPSHVPMVLAVLADACCWWWWCCSGAGNEIIRRVGLSCVAQSSWLPSSSSFFSCFSSFLWCLSFETTEKRRRGEARALGGKKKKKKKKKKRETHWE